MSKAIKRTLSKVIVISPEEYEITEIVSGQPLSEIPDILGISKTAEIKELSNPAQAGKIPNYIPARALHAQAPLSRLAEPLGLEIFVRFYEINGIPIYFVDEPPVTELVKKLYIYFKSRLGEVGLTGGDIISFIEDEFEDLGLSPKYVLMEPEVKAAIYYVWRDLLGYGPLEIPMEDPDVEEVSWFAHDGPVLVVDKVVAGKYPNAEFVFTNIFIPKYIDDVKKKFVMTQIARGLTSKARSGLTVSKPLAEARIPDPTGIGFHRLAAHSDITSRSPGVTIRKFPHVKLNLAKIISYGNLNELMAAYLLIQLIKRGFVLIVGGMASGKTTLLQSLISALPISYKVVTVEDTPELSTPSQNWHPLYVRRAPKASELEDVDFSRLVIHSLRHRGTIVTLGEARGEEFAYLIQAAASGHGAICLRRNAKLIIKIGDGEARLVNISDIENIINTGQPIYVLSYDIMKNKCAWRKIIRFYRTKSKQWVVIRTQSGRVLESTLDHRLPVYADGEIVVKPASDVRPGDKLLIAPLASVDTEPIKYVIVDDVYVELTKKLGILTGALLLGRLHQRYAVLYKTTEVVEAAEEFARVFNLHVAVGQLVKIHGVFAVKLFEKILDLIKTQPLMLPRQFVQGLGEVLKVGMTVKAEPDVLHGLHFALETIWIDSIVDESSKTLYVSGLYPPVDEVVSIEVKNEEDDAFDIEVDKTHTFVTTNSIVSMNCTFHAQDPFSIFARITAPPINAAPEALKLITSVVHVAYAKTFARGRPEAVRRVMRIFEIRDVNKLRHGGLEGGYEMVFEWNPLEDIHYPRLFEKDRSVKVIEPLVELWKRSDTLRTLGKTLYSDREAERILMDVLALALFLREQVDKQVFDMKQLMFNISAFYLEMDNISMKLWNKLKDKIIPETKHIR